MWCLIAFGNDYGCVVVFFAVSEEKLLQSDEIKGEEDDDGGSWNMQRRWNQWSLINGDSSFLFSFLFS